MYLKDLFLSFFKEENSKKIDLRETLFYLEIRMKKGSLISVKVIHIKRIIIVIS